MAIIYSYPTVTPELQDLLVGTEIAIQGGEDTPRTRTFTIQSIVDLVETAAQTVPTLQQVTTAGPNTTVGITATTNEENVVSIKGVNTWAGSGAFANIGVLGQIYGNTAGTGIKGIGTLGRGVWGISSTEEGVYGESIDGIGVQGTSSNIGVEGSGAVYGVYASSLSKAFGTDLLEGSTGLYITCESSPFSGLDDNPIIIFTDGIETTKVDRSGEITANNFIKRNGLLTQSLMANGTIKNISIFNNSTTPQNITAATVTYLTGSNISTANIKAGSIVNWDIAVLKTAAGVAPPVFTVRFGTTGTTADSTLLTFIGSAQTAVADGGLFSIKCTFKTVGAGTTAVLAGYYTLMHNAQVVGLSVLPVNFAFQTSPGFNSTLANAVLGITVDSGIAAAWTINQVTVKLENRV